MSLDKSKWDILVLENSGEFLQSWDWGVLQEKLGRKVIRFFDEKLGLAQIIVTRLPFGLSWAYVPRGPVVFDGSHPKALLDRLVGVLPPGCVFAAFEPADKKSIPPDLPRFKSRQPTETLILDLKKTEADILARMHPKTRYNISLAQRKGFKFAEVEAADFYKVLKSAAGRHGFRIYPQMYFEKLSESESAKFFGVLYNNKIIAAGCFYSFGGAAAYIHGGSLYDFRSLMAPYFLHWETIRHFRERGLSRYDFWGIDEKKWPGVTRFKTGFGRETKTYPGAFVKVLRPFWFRAHQWIKGKRPVD